MAVEGWLPWSAGGATVHAPFIEEAGSPVLLVGRLESEQLLRTGHAWAESPASGELGSLRIGGTLWPVTADACLDSLQTFRLEHAECRDCWGPLRSHLVGLRVDFVVLSDPRTGVLSTIDPDEYAAARPDPLVAAGLRIRQHLNADHQDDLLTFGARLLGVDRSRLAAVTVEWIDGDGLELAVIDGVGSAIRRLPFRLPLAGVKELGDQLHHLLTESC